MRPFRRVAASATLGASLGLFLGDPAAGASEFQPDSGDPGRQLQTAVEELRVAQGGITAEEPARRVNPERIGKAPPREEAVQTVAVMKERGVLTGQGRIVIEPSIEYQHTDVNKFVVGGVAILDTVLIGSFEATQANRDAVTAALAIRYGLTNRFEVEARVPYVYRHDSITNTILESGTTASKTETTTRNLGDVELAARYQITSGQGDWPFLIANVRMKTPTGLGPYDVERDGRGIERELATGSGFWAVEPSLTAIIPDDPLVFFANIGYLVNLSEDIDKEIGGRFIGAVEPGNAVRFGFGVGVGLNEKTSVTLAYSHDFIDKTRSVIDGTTVYSDSLTVGTLSLGVNRQVNDKFSINVTVGVGVTGDSPNLQLTLKTPFGFNP